jgi:hypothetical protein
MTDVKVKKNIDDIKSILKRIDEDYYLKSEVDLMNKRSDDMVHQKFVPQTSFDKNMSHSINELTLIKQKFPIIEKTLEE